jgi:hypothetical protein
MKMLTTKKATEHPTTAGSTAFVLQPQTMLNWMGPRDVVIKAKRGVEGRTTQETRPVLPVKDPHWKWHVDLVLLARNGRPNSLCAGGQEAFDAHSAFKKIMGHVAPGSVPSSRENGDHSLLLPQGYTRNSLF